MPNLYVEAATLKTFAVANEADDNTVWDLLAESVSRLFDRECEVSDGFFNPQGGGAAVARSFTGNGTRYVRIVPYLADSIATIDIGGVDYFTAVVAERQYKEREGFLVFDFEILDGASIEITAKYGFAKIPAEVQQACIEQALMMWRRKDLTFAEISGVPTAAVVAEFSPTFLAVTKRYRELYSSNSYFV